MSFFFASLFRLPRNKNVRTTEGMIGESEWCRNQLLMKTFYDKRQCHSDLIHWVSSSLHINYSSRKRKRDSNYLLIIVGDAERMLSFNSCWHGEDEKREEEKSIIISLPLPCGAFFFRIIWFCRKKETLNFLLSSS